MTCKQCAELITDYQHGELDAASDAAVYQHIQSCASCREEFAAQTSLTQTLQAAYARELDLPTSVIAGVRQAVRKDKTAGVLHGLQSLWRPIVLAPTAAAILLVAGISTYLHNTYAAPQLSADYYVQQHVAHTMTSQVGDRAYSAYLLTSNDAPTNAQAR